VPSISTSVLTRALPHLFALAIALYGGLLRLDAFVGKYGVVEQPALVRLATRDVAPIAASLRPSRVEWKREANPFVGGDPYNYLRFAREMTSFYQPHVREPVFLALTRGSLWLTGDQDIGVGVASAIGSTLAIYGVFLLGAAIFTPLCGLVAAALFAIELEVITWAPDGWRDDTFTATVVFAAWSLIRLRQDPTFPRALAAGVLCGVSCLTRITAVTFIVPAMIWMLIDNAPSARRRLLSRLGLAAAMAAAVVGPYLVSCAIATGDPLFAINYHTVYYRAAEGMAFDQPMSAAGYLRSKMAARPIGVIDTAFIGLFVQPFATKWNGFDAWLPHLGALLRWLSIAGLAIYPAFRDGRLTLAILLGSLVPYMITWNLGDGSAFRFTMHAYPFFLVAAAMVPIGLARLAANRWRDRSWQWPAPPRHVAWTAAVALTAFICGVTAYYSLPWYVVRENIAAGEATSLDTGSRDRVFFGDGWSPPHADGIVVRVATASPARVSVPLPAQRAYDLVLRIDPVAPEQPTTVQVLFNQQQAATLTLTSNPERMGSYRISLPASMVRAGDNELALVTDPMVNAAAAGPRFSWLDPASRLGVRLWYVRVLPVVSPGS
jgi:hypothetical protein